MNAMLKTGLLTVALGLAFCPADAGAAVATHIRFSNAVNYCQAFTPGPSNTIRNRVIGAENIGPPIAVACNFHHDTNGAPGNTNPTLIEVFFTNGGTTAASVSCTLLTGTSAGVSVGTQYAVTKTVSIGASGAFFLDWTTADNPTAGATDLGSRLVGVNCNLPTNMTISATFVQWSADNGV